MLHIDSLQIRAALPSDAKAMQAIYAPYVEQTAVTFEYAMPSVEEFCRRLEAVRAKYPWLVAEVDGRVVGYAYASTFKTRDAYRWSVETSIYVDASMKRGGIGGRLYEALEQRLREQGILNLNACISYVDPEDEFLTLDSVRFHERLGYKHIGTFTECAYKFGRWYSMVYYEKHI